ncbi:hypothetical protein Pcinc_005765 [Petrolisthes cinctipes]|uniref:Queuosine 5'-phosphate N-glycosylase/hydrolase n=1 Tax=Petrolisthes cinctipes TaxID=88211 RepID=A0AAE1L271_PETCI|nr:hypothetical protein Pcinc_005765 [Petrolisthes cinctipes]
MPLFEERLNVMKEVGQTLLDKYEGSFAAVIRKCEKKGIRLVELVTNDFPSFNDTAEFEGQKVAMFKRAQIVVSDTWLLFRGDREEAKIRGCSIHGIELIVEEAKKMLREQGRDPSGLNSIKTDFFLWEYRMKNSELLMKIPYHRVR